MMNSEVIFSVANVAALGAWLLLACAPLRREPILLGARAAATALAVLYVVLLASALAQGGAPDVSTLAGIGAVFSEPDTALIGWVHYLAFDLWFGAWQVEEAARRRLPHLTVLPCLALTFLVGPVGLVAFLALRAAFGRRESGVA